MKILGIETSCDDTAAAVVEDGSRILSNVVASQSVMHRRYGGIIPEVSSREHLTSILPVVHEALDEASVSAQDIDAVAVTHGPGLAGSLLVGVNTAKGLALSWEKPVIGINHLEGHIYSAWLEELHSDSSARFPLVCLIASGGHTELALMHDHQEYEILARTRDDAAGEAFDKVARVLGLGFPGGPEIQREAETSENRHLKFPRPSIKNSMDFSFSGLKTAVVRQAETDGFYPPKSHRLPTQQEVSDYAEAFQSAVVDCLLLRTCTAVNEHNAKGVVIGGGVAANRELRRRANKELNVPVLAPRPALCTDNGAMIAAAAFHRWGQSFPSQWELDVAPSLALS